MEHSLVLAIRVQTVLEGREVVLLRIKFLMFKLLQQKNTKLTAVSKTSLLLACITLKIK